MPVSSYSLGNNYIDANNSLLQHDSTSPVTQVFSEEKLPMNDGSYLRTVLVPTMRMLTSTISSTNYYKFYFPTLASGENLYRSQSVTLSGDGITRITRSDVDQVTITVSFPKAASMGFDSSFFNFKSNTITLNSTSTPRLTANSVVEFYIGKVVVSIGQV